MSAPTNDLVLVGVGGGGARFVEETVARFQPGMRAVVFDSDVSAFREGTGIEYRQIGVARLEGRGTGGDTIKGRAAAQDDSDLIRNALAGTRLAVVVTCLGGGFGSGAAPEVLRAVRAMGGVSFCIVTSPFAFEGQGRASVAMRQMPLVQETADAAALVSMDALFGAAGDAEVAVAMHGAADTMADFLSLFWNMLAKPGFISFGVERMIAALSDSGGHTRLSVASKSGDGRAAAAVDALFSSPLLNDGGGLQGAGTVILGVVAGNDLRLAELTEISESFGKHLPAGCVLSFGTVLDDACTGSVKLVGVFFDSVIKLEDEAPAERISSPGHPMRKQHKDALALDAHSGRFKGGEGTIYEGEDLDVPTFLRRNLPLDK